MPAGVSVCLQDYCKSNQPISLKLEFMIGPTRGKNPLTFYGDLVPDTDSGSLFNRKIGHFGEILSAFLIQSPAAFHETLQNN